MGWRGAQRRSDGEALATLGAARVDDFAPATGFHAHEKAVRACAARLGGLIGTFHVCSQTGKWTTGRARARPQKTAHYPSKVGLQGAATIAPPPSPGGAHLPPLPAMSSHHTAASSFADASAVALWPACLGALAQEVPADLFDNWIRPLAVLPGEAPDSLRLQVAGAFKRDRTRRQFDALIAATLERLGGRRIDIAWEVAPQEPRVPSVVETPAATPAAAPETAPPPDAACAYRYTLPL